jgi:hypothetical protein
LTYGNLVVTGVVVGCDKQQRQNLRWSPRNIKFNTIRIKLSPDWLEEYGDSGVWNVRTNMEFFSIMEILEESKL